jgi:hypothetical protein
VTRRAKLILLAGCALVGAAALGPARSALGPDLALGAGATQALIGAGGEHAAGR